MYSLACAFRSCSAECKAVISDVFIFSSGPHPPVFCGLWWDFVSSSFDRCTAERQVCNCCLDPSQFLDISSFLCSGWVRPGNKIQHNNKTHFSLNGTTSVGLYFKGRRTQELILMQKHLHVKQNLNVQFWIHREHCLEATEWNNSNKT